MIMPSLPTVAASTTFAVIRAPTTETIPLSGSKLHMGAVHFLGRVVMRRRSVGNRRSKSASKRSKAGFRSFSRGRLGHASCVKQNALVQ